MSNCCIELCVSGENHAFVEQADAPECAASICHHTMTACGWWKAVDMSCYGCIICGTLLLYWLFVAPVVLILDVICLLVYVSMQTKASHIFTGTRNDAFQGEEDLQVDPQ
eukprot:375347_1